MITSVHSCGHSSALASNDIDADILTDEERGCTPVLGEEGDGDAEGDRNG